MEKNVENPDISILLQPIRFKLALTLINSKEPMYLEQIAAEMGENSRLIAHHLDILEDSGLVSSKFQIIQHDNNLRGFAGRFFSATPKLKESLEVISGMIARQQEGHG
ncbi:MAG: helix-turn-helix transcriptional regulator [Nitrososphaerota archaeon]|jgi:predicted transcriptional regulator|nr:helix-turn-helix transcriptional regulator [Nitrososphaerota archaeon]